MNDWECRKDSVYVSRDAGYSKIESISPENRRKAKDKMDNPDIVSGNYKLKELFADMGIVVHPERMTNWYHY